MAAAINEYKLGMLQLMLKDPKIKSCIIMDGAYAGEVRITKEGDILLGRTRYGWINRAFNQYNKIDFFTLASKIAVIITGPDTIGGNPSDLREMVGEIVDKCISSNDKESVIELLFFYLTFMCSNSPLKSRYIKTDFSSVNNGEFKRTKIRGKGSAYINLGRGGYIPIDLDFEN